MEEKALEAKGLEGKAAQHLGKDEGFELRIHQETKGPAMVLLGSGRGAEEAAAVGHGAESGATQPSRCAGENRDPLGTHGDSREPLQKDRMLGGLAAPKEDTREAHQDRDLQAPTGCAQSPTEGAGEVPTGPSRAASGWSAAGTFSGFCLPSLLSHSSACIEFT